ncbi:response regulator transcription factor [Sediminibacterium roseum]|uniref:Response regulator transcription factor n=1 Tax=Sediminibacterium roseum TaxID=1978412 RepID=A0ABX0A3T5_9BACT|nr:response regulator transcription factor [Sediminibacterium roseum]NCI52088.1 response regulator transcription factor [Sediminibacterium roseum]
MTQYRIILADDHQFLLEGVLAILKEQSSLNVVATAQNGFELIDAVTKHRPDLVILDMNMPGYDGLQSLDRIKKDFPKTKVLVLSNYSQPELVNEVRSKNAEGYLVKNSSAAELTGAIAAILSGKTHYPDSRRLQAVKEDSFFFDDFLKKYQLTKREVEIIKLVCGEMSNKDMANALFLSELTIKTHRRNILRKLDIKNTAGLVLFAKENRLI